MGYLEQRDAILVHAKAAALAADPKFTNVATGMPALGGSKGCRVFYGGEGEAPRMPMQGSLRGEFIGEHVALVAWWAVSTLATGQGAGIDTEMYTFKHELRTRVIGDQTLGGQSIGVVMDYVEPDLVTFGGTRYALLGADFTVAFTEYQF